MTAEEFWSYIRRNHPTVAAFLHRKKLLKLARVLLINAILWAFAVFTVEEMNKPNLRIPTLLIVALVSVAYTWFARPRGLIFSKPYVGKIEKATISTHMQECDGPGMYGKGMRMSNFWVLTVRGEDGKTHQIELEPKYEHCYRVGDRIGVLPAIQYPFLLDTPDDHPTVCWWCGSINRPEDRECMNCGRDMV
ncbi:MAG: hypothetical protein IJZ80_01775 [Clostridia bacterium]|nr:hypothetical protein [Clostridia bacterium]